MATNRIAEIADDIAAMVNGGMSISGAMRRLRSYNAPEDLLSDAQREYERRVGRIRNLRDPQVLVEQAKMQGYWYAGPRQDDIFWPGLRDQLGAELADDALASVNDASDKVLQLMRPPGVEEFATRGLVLGYVQSGKTTNFMAVISKAADVGYRLFIVLSGITDNLRSQTQERLEGKLVGGLTDQWYLLTSLDSDFFSPENAGFLLGNQDHRLLAVVKKNPYRLRRLKKWLDSAGPDRLGRCPILVIDDEADQASIDVGVRGRTSKINGLIRQILERPKAAYIAYTATPFANLLIDPSESGDLYPRDFVVDLPRPQGYFGPEQIFGREPLTQEEADAGAIDGLDVIRHVPPDDIPLVQPPRGRGAVNSWEASIAPSLDDALCWFAMSTSARRSRGLGNPHATMLIHTSMLAAAHQKLAEPLRELLANIGRRVREGDSALRERMRRQWEDEKARLTQTEPELPAVSFDAVWYGLPEVLDRATVVIDDYLSDQRLSYSSEEPATAVVIGGNTLSRGLTLEGLCCSYFVRSASAYDTLLQMGRWFGYRAGYGDFTRIWMTSDLEQWFFDLARVEEEIRRDIRRYADENLRPSRLAVRIRSHPAMAITAAAKMRAAVRAQMTYSGQRPQTILFHHRNAQWLEANMTATRSLIAEALTATEETVFGTGRRGVANVPVSAVIKFLSSYRFHERSQELRSDLLSRYIEQENKAGALLRWNIVIIEHPDDANGTVDLGLSSKINLIQRAKLDIRDLAWANIKALISTIDRVADMPQTNQELRNIIDSQTDAKWRALRDDVLGDVGLLALYPISKDSQPRSPAKPDGTLRRMPLDAEDHVIGVALFFPTARGRDSDVTYYCADLRAEAIEDVDEEQEQIQLADAVDEQAAEQGDTAK
jgi:hypothetical protein